MTEKTDISPLISSAISLTEKVMAARGVADLDRAAVAASGFVAKGLLTDLVKLLEAERQQREAAEKELRIRSHQLVKADASVEDLEAELAAIRGKQEPVAFLIHEKARPSRLSFRNLKGFVSDADIVEHELWQEPLFTRQPKPVVVLSDCDIGAVSHMAHWYTEEQCEAWVAGVEHAKKQMLAAGIVVKDGE